LDAAYGEHHHLQQPVGIALHEWRGASVRTKTWLAVSLMVLVSSTVVVATGTT